MNLISKGFHSESVLITAIDGLEQQDKMTNTIL